ncbi:MAG TPA: hypothetical protein VN894_13080 [Polyangiaceae bacterium]|nr:hypothetical protein [Polyangiaceae bacterium]
MKKLLALMAVAALAIVASAGTAGAQRTYLGCGSSTSLYCCDMDILYGYQAPAECYTKCAAHPLTLANHNLTQVCYAGNCPGTVIGSSNTGAIDLANCSYDSVEGQCQVNCPSNGTVHTFFVYHSQTSQWRDYFVDDSKNCEDAYNVTINN